MEVRQWRERKKRGCRVFLSCENQIFLKLPRRWLTGNAATAMTGRGHSHLHTQFNPSQSSWHHINHAFISTAAPAKKKTPKNYISIPQPVSEPPADQSGEGGRSRPSPSIVALMDRHGPDQTRLKRTALWSAFSHTYTNTHTLEITTGISASQLRQKDFLNFMTLLFSRLQSGKKKSHTVHFTYNVAFLMGNKCISTCYALRLHIWCE